MSCRGEGFGQFKFDGMGGGLGQSGGEAFRADFEAMLRLVDGVHQRKPPSGHGDRSITIGNGDRSNGDAWVSLTIGTWPSPFWLLWADSIWRDGPDVGLEGAGSPRERRPGVRESPPSPRVGGRIAARSRP